MERSHGSPWPGIADAETMEFFTEYVAKLTKTREEIKTWADVLELDDFVSFGA